MKSISKNKIVLILGILALIFTGAVSARKFNHLLQVKSFKKSHATNTVELKTGDIIFQSSVSPQCKAIQLATHSEYSHCGMIIKNNDACYVLEAVQPVRYTPYDQWIARGKGGHFAIRRLKNAEQVLTNDVVEKMKQAGKSFEGKNYDIYFNWSDENIYCSELVWKVYKQSTGLEIGKLEKLKDFDLSSKIVQQTLNERYGKQVPYNDLVISPASIFRSELLTTVILK